MSTTMDNAAGSFDTMYWTRQLRDELRERGLSGRVGTVLVSETERVRVWHLTLKPGERLPFHRHVNDYFWTVLTDGRGRSRFEDGAVREMDYRAGDTRHFHFELGGSMLHDLENTGESELVFVTVEMLGGPNPPLVTA